jgi:hypothetical protein
MYLGIYDLFALGNDRDDYTGCDVTNGLAFSYNADTLDGDADINSYGIHPPALGMKLIAGPYLPEDGIDNPADQCDEGINGLNFGNGKADDERLGLSSFTTGLCFSEYQYLPPVCYNTMKALNSSGMPYQFGDSLINSLFFNYCNFGGQGPPCRYLYPWDSDTLCNWGTAGMNPEGGYNINGHYWTEQTVHNLAGNRKGISSVGPFTFHPGETVPLDYCFTWARDYQGDNLSSVKLLRNRIAGMKDRWNDLIALPRMFNDISESNINHPMLLYPNPTRSFISVISNEKGNSRFSVISLDGRQVLSGFLLPGKNILELDELSSGIYILKAGMYETKIVKL